MKNGIERPKSRFAVLVGIKGVIGINGKDTAVKCFNHYVKESLRPSTTEQPNGFEGVDVTLFDGNDIMSDYDFIGSKTVKEIEERARTPFIDVPAGA
jgi:hypothetical protein